MILAMQEQEEYTPLSMCSWGGLRIEYPEVYCKYTDMNRGSCSWIGMVTRDGDGLVVYTISCVRWDGKKYRARNLVDTTRWSVGRGGLENKNDLLEESGKRTGALN